MIVPDALVITVIGLAVTQVLAVAAYVFKKLLEFERMCDKLNELTAKKPRKKK